MRRSLAALALALLLPLPALAGTITVKPGETLSEIADRLGISMKRLMELNGINKADHVEVGQKLKVPGPSGSSTRASGGGAVATGRVTVREGDTLSDIAVRQGMSLNQLIALNGLSRADHVEVGQTLKVTGKGATAAAPNPFRKGATMHVVRSGESLSAIAEGYGVPMSRLVAINAINDPDHVEVGSQLKLKGEPAAPRPRPVVAATPRPVVAAAPRPTPAPAPRERPLQAEAPRPEPTGAAEVPKTSQPVVTQAIASASTAVAPSSSAIAPAASSAAAAPIGTTPVARTPIAAAAAAASSPVAAAVGGGGAGGAPEHRGSEHQFAPHGPANPNSVARRRPGQRTFRRGGHQQLAPLRAPPGRLVELAADGRQPGGTDPQCQGRHSLPRDQLRRPQDECHQRGRRLAHLG
jgi:LysM repeat protein